MYRDEVIILCRIISIIFIPLARCNTGDPCSVGNHKPFPDLYLGSRNEHCITSAAHSPQCDYFLQEGWYTFQNASLLNHCPTNGTCGVGYPIWMNGIFPDAKDGIVNRTACTVIFDQCCNDTLPIQVKNCSGFYVYHLVPTHECSSVYCLESPLPCDEPTTIAPSTTTPWGTPDCSQTLLIGLLSGGAVLCLIITAVIANVFLKKKSKRVRVHEPKQANVNAATVDKSYYGGVVHENTRSPPPTYDPIR